MAKRLHMACFIRLAFLVSSLTVSAASLTFLRHPTSQTVQAGSHVIFKCSVLLTYKKITYEWQHNNQTIRTEKQSRFTIRNDGSLRIADTHLDDSGSYQCIAMVRAKRSGIIRRKARSHIAKLTVEGMCSEATITTRRAQGKKFAIGTILSLRCRCPSSSPGTTRWIKNGVTVSATNGRITVDQRKLNINRTSFADSGNYTCYVTVAELGTAKSETVEIWVGSTPRITVPPPTSLEVSKGQTVRLNCLATGTPPPLIYWYYAGLEWSEHVKNSIKNDSKYTIFVNGTFILRDLQAEDIGFYECGARNVMGTTSRKTKIFVPINFITTPRNTTAAVGKSIVLRCNATGLPTLDISWGRERGKLDKKRFRQLANGNLHIRDIKMTDAGQYFCIAANIHDLKEVKVTLRVIESDVIKINPSHKYTVEAFLGARRKITCDFHGSPPITVTWTKKGTDELPFRVEQNGNSLVIKRVALSDAGQYICNGSNAFSSQASYVNVSVYDPLRFLIEPRNQTAFINESVWFHCAATGSPKPKITWLKADQGGRPLNEEKYRAYANGSLRIKDVQYSDMGRYFCLVATRTDLRQRTVHLEVKGKEDETRQNPSGPDSKAFSNSANKLIFSRTFATFCTLTFIRTMLCS